MRNLFDEPECGCKGQGVRVGETGRFEFCSCEAGAREREQDSSGFSQHIGRNAGEAMRELRDQLKGIQCTVKT